MLYLKALLGALLLVGSLGGLWFFTSSKSFDPPKNLVEDFEKGTPDFELHDILRDKLFKSKEELRGSHVIVNFWASWCEPCAKEIPDMLKLVESYRGKLKLVLISEDSDISERDAFLSAFPDLKNQSVFVVADVDRQVMQDFGVQRLPESFLLDKEGRLIRKIVGYIDWYTPDSLSYLDSLILLK